MTTEAKRHPIVLFNGFISNPGPHTWHYLANVNAVKPQMGRLINSGEMTLCGRVIPNRWNRVRNARHNSERMCRACVHALKKKALACLAPLSPALR